MLFSNTAAAGACAHREQAAPGLECASGQMLELRDEPGGEERQIPLPDLVNNACNACPLKYSCWFRCIFPLCFLSLCHGISVNVTFHLLPSTSVQGHVRARSQGDTVPRACTILSARTIPSTCKIQSAHMMPSTWMIPSICMMPNRCTNPSTSTIPNSCMIPNTCMMPSARTIQAHAQSQTHTRPHTHTHDAQRTPGAHGGSRRPFPCPPCCQLLHQHPRPRRPSHGPRGARGRGAGSCPGCGRLGGAAAAAPLTLGGARRLCLVLCPPYFLARCRPGCCCAPGPAAGSREAPPGRSGEGCSPFS